MIATMNLLRARSSNSMTHTTATLRQRDHTIVEGVTYKIAQSWEEREAAFRLLYHAYQRAGLVEQNPLELRVLPYHLQDSATVLR